MMLVMALALAALTLACEEADTWEVDGVRLPHRQVLDSYPIKLKLALAGGHTEHAVGNALVMSAPHVSPLGGTVTCCAVLERPSQLYTTQRIVDYRCVRGTSC